MTESPPNRVDLGKIRVGDHCEVRMRVSQLGVSDLGLSGHPLFLIEPNLLWAPKREDIVRHIASPRPITPGSRVRSLHLHPDLNRDWVVVHIHRGSAWVEAKEVFAVLPLEDLALVEGAG